MPNLQIEATFTIHCEQCGLTKPAHEFYDGPDDKLVFAVLYVRNIASKEHQHGDHVRRKEVCYDCFKAAGNNPFVTVEREGNNFYVTQCF